MGDDWGVSYKEPCELTFSALYSDSSINIRNRGVSATRSVHNLHLPASQRLPLSVTDNDMNQIRRAVVSPGC